MKIVFYRTLLTRARNLTSIERIMYSFLISKSITYLDEVFYQDGSCINMDKLHDYIYENNYIDLYPISLRKISKELNIALQTVVNGLQKLRNNRYIKDNRIYVNEELLEKGYFELYVNKKIKGELLIFYSYIKQKSFKYKGCIDTYKRKLAQDLGTTKTAITKLLNRLYKSGLAKRLENGKLLIN